MAVSGDTLGFLTDQSTLWAVVLGAFLATIGGFFATQYERFLDKRERERNAALFFGEVLSTFSILLTFAQETKQIGDPFGQVTMRMLYSARREIDIYDRNRESLFDLRHSELRARIQTIIIRLTMTLEGVFEATTAVAAMQTQLRSVASDGERAELQVHIDSALERRETAFEFLVETAVEFKPMIKDLEPIARHSFERIGEVARNLRGAPTAIP